MMPTAPALPTTQGRGSGPAAATILALALWFGVGTGLVEGATFLVLPALNRMMGVWWSILWISPAVDLVVFGAIGLAFAGAAKLFPTWPTVRMAAWAFAFLAGAVTLTLAGYEYVHSVACLILAAGLATVFVRGIRRREAATLAFVRRRWRAPLAVVATVFLAVEAAQWVQERAAVARLPAAAAGSPNVLVVVVDALRADHLTCYGYARPTSPNIDRLARSGVVLERAFSTAPYTLPSHASMLTGRYPHEHGVEWTAARAMLTCPYPTLGEALQARGYRTAGFSANTFWFTRELGFGRGFSRFEDVFHSAEDRVLRTFVGRVFESVVLRRLGWDDIPARKRAPETNRSVLSWIDRDRGRPFFAFINYMDVHDPYRPPEPFRSRFSPGSSPGGTINWRIGRDDPPLTPQQLQSEIDAYDGAIAFADHHLGQLLAALEDRGLGNDTLVVVTSDHGEAFGEHGMLLHGHSLYREEIHVPLIVSYPGRVPAGERFSEPVTNAAIPATVLSLQPAPDHTTFPGPSLASLWQGPTSAPGRPLLSELGQRDWVMEKFPVRHGWMRSLIDPDWHYIQHQTLPGGLYDLQADPREQDNQADRPDRKAVVDQFRQRLQVLRPPFTARTTAAVTGCRGWLTAGIDCRCGAGWSTPRLRTREAGGLTDLAAGTNLLGATARE